MWRFNASDNPYLWSGFSLKWYPDLFGDAEILAGLRALKLWVARKFSSPLRLPRFTPESANFASACSPFAPAIMPASYAT